MNPSQSYPPRDRDPQRTPNSAAPEDSSPAQPSATPSDGPIILETAVLQGLGATANVGDWTLSLFQQQLSVNLLGSNRGGVYNVEALPPSTSSGTFWKTLVGRDGAALPVSISRQPDGSIGVYLLSEPAPMQIWPPLPGY
jgi:hypothetical protein